MNELVRGKNKIDFKVNGRQFSFEMTFDSDNACDTDLRSEFENMGICEPEVVCAMERIVRDGDTVIDGGANIGFFTIYLAQLVGPKGKVYAIEPGQNNLWKLEENVRLNKLKNVEIVRKPLWMNHNKVTLYMRHEGGRNSLWPDGNCPGKAEFEPCLLSEFPPHRLAKLDIEGAEVAAIRGYGGGDDCQPPFIIAEMNEPALGFLGFTQDDLRALQNVFLLDKDGRMPIYVPPEVKIVTDRQNANILLSSIGHVASVWTEVRV
jgi:FkbM family methyltransferase